MHTSECVTHINVFAYRHVFVNVDIYVSVCLPVCLSVLSVYLSIHLSICLFVYLSVCLSVCVCLWLCLYLGMCKIASYKLYVTLRAVRLRACPCLSVFILSGRESRCVCRDRERQGDESSLDVQLTSLREYVFMSRQAVVPPMTLTLVRRGRTTGGVMRDGARSGSLVLFARPIR